MNYAGALVLVVLAVVFLLAGIVAQSPAAFALAIAASALSVVLLGRRLRQRHQRRVRTFVTNAPPRADPAWTLDLRDKKRSDEELPVELEIDHIIDGYHDLVAAEVLPSLETLSVEELRKVIAVEKHGRNRQAIIKRAEVLITLTSSSRPEKAVAIEDPDAPTPRKRKVPVKEIDDRSGLKKSGPNLSL